LRGIELAGARGPFKFQMETFNSKYNATGITQTLMPLLSAATSMGVQVKTQYMEVMYNITGESWADAYKGGAFGGIKPKTNFMTDYGGQVGMGTGAWQVGFRTSKYTSDLDNTATCLEQLLLQLVSLPSAELVSHPVAFKMLKLLPPTPMP
jgi:phosphate-selective porin OprO and OprP